MKTLASLPVMITGLILMAMNIPHMNSMMTSNWFASITQLKTTRLAMHFSEVSMKEIPGSLQMEALGSGMNVKTSMKHHSGTVTMVNGEPPEMTSTMMIYTWKHGMTSTSGNVDLMETAWTCTKVTMHALPTGEVMTTVMTCGNGVMLVLNGGNANKPGATQENGLTHPAITMMTEWEVPSRLPSQLLLQWLLSLMLCEQMNLK